MNIKSIPSRIAVVFGIVLPECCQAFALEKTVTVQGTTSSVSNIINWIIEACVKYSFQVLGGLMLLGIGWFVGNFFARLTRDMLKKKNVDVTVTKFIAGAVKLLVMIFAAIAALSKFGIEIAPIIAGLSVVGFGTSFALQGPLSNYAAGITLVFTKPFKVGDIIEVVNVHGEVEDMTLSRTVLITIDGDKIVIPNKHIIGEIIHNFSALKRVDVTVGVSYSCDIDHVLRVIKEVVDDDARVITSRGAKIGISEFAESSVNVFVRLWCKQEHYYDVKFAINRNILQALKKNQIEIPFPQRDIRIIEHKVA
ncbi:MAG: mechanosensitive ion channel family protein [Candidatus Omnitrophica bacterium]|nr:mechanosensitive ion channel family protein [Candidatus Omnitrophota bacterium]